MIRASHSSGASSSSAGLAAAAAAAAALRCCCSVSSCGFVIGKTRHNKKIRRVALQGQKCYFFQLVHRRVSLSSLSDSNWAAAKSMVKLYDAKQSAVLAWSSDVQPLLAAGTLAGVMDDTFSSSSSLAIHNPLSNKQLVSLDAPSKFHSLAWSEPSAKFASGLIAGAMENSNIELWDASKLIQGDELSSASVATYTDHSSAVLSVAFNPLQSHIMGSSSSKGEILIWDTNKGSSFAPGEAVSPISRVSCFEWNRCVSNIFGAAGDSGYASIWDLKAKREVMQLHYQGLNMSVLQWHPSQSTKLVTATDSDSDPVIITWDLRNASVPEMVIKGHKRGILSLDWCRQDPALLLSSGKDDSTKLWNPIEGTEIASYPSLPNWVHQTKFAPKLPEIFASASLGKNIVVQSLQDTSEPVSVKVQSNDDSEFWSQISTTETQKPNFHISQAPAWLKRPISASFGFGGKLVITKGKDIKIVNVSKNEKMDTSAKDLITALASNDYKTICQNKVKEEVKLNEKSDWELLANLLTDGKTKTIEEIIKGDESKDSDADTKAASDADTDLTTDDVDDIDDEDFFAQLGSAKNVQSKTQYTPSGNFSLFSDEAKTFETDATKFILANKKEDALDLCISEDKFLEAMIIAMNGTESMKAKARGAYFAKYASESTFSRLLYSVSSNNVSDIVSNAEVTEESWKHLAKCIHSFTINNPVEFKKEMKLLGDRLIESKVENARDLAFKCYVAADALDKIAAIWINELETYENFYLETPNSDGGRNTSFEARFKALGEVIEKTIVFESICESSDSEGLELLGNAFQEYANYLANFGHFELAYKILEKVNDSIPGIKEEKNRIAKAFFKNANESASTRASKSYSLNPKNINTSNLTPGVPSLIPSNPYTSKLVAQANDTAQLPPVPTPSTNLSANNNARANRYTPLAALESLQAKPQQPPSVFVPTNDGPSLPPPPPVKKDVGGWNDLPAGLSKTPKPSSQNLRTAYNVSTPSPVPIVPNAVPPPPHSRTSSLSNIKPQTLQQPKTRNPYQPKPGNVEPVRVPSTLNSPIVQTPMPPPVVPKAKKNPYAPVGTSQSLAAQPSAGAGALHPPPPQSFGQSVPPPPQQQQSIPPPPPANPYAVPKPNGFSAPIQNPPQQQLGQQAASNPYAPQPPVGATAGNGTSNPYAPPPAAAAVTPASNPYAPPPPAASNPYAPKSSNPYAPSSMQQPNNGGAVPPPPPPAATVKSGPPPPPPAAAAASVSTPVPASAAAFSPVQQQAEPVQTPSVPALTEEMKTIQSVLLTKLEEVRPVVPEKFSKQVVDSGRRFEFLFAAMQAGSVSDETISKLTIFANALQAKDYETAKAQLASFSSEEGGKWIQGVKRLVSMAEVMNI